MREIYFRQQVIGMLKAYGDYRAKAVQAGISAYPTDFERTCAQEHLPEALREFESVVPENIRKGLEEAVKRVNQVRDKHLTP